MIKAKNGMSFKEEIFVISLITWLNNPSNFGKDIKDIISTILWKNVEIGLIYEFMLKANNLGIKLNDSFYIVIYQKLLQIYIEKFNIVNVSNIFVHTNI